MVDWGLNFSHLCFSSRRLCPLGHPQRSLRRRLSPPFSPLRCHLPPTLVCSRPPLCALRSPLERLRAWIPLPPTPNQRAAAAGRIELLSGLSGQPQRSCRNATPPPRAGRIGRDRPAIGSPILLGGIWKLADGLFGVCQRVRVRVRVRLAAAWAKCPRRPLAHNTFVQSNI
jgi:hypothetical protein